MTPAEELTAAADKLERLAESAAPDWRVDADNFLAMPQIDTPYMIGPLKGEPDARFTMVLPSDATTAYVWQMRPEVGKALAKLLRVEADLATASGPGWAVDESVALARLIIGGES